MVSVGQFYIEDDDFRQQFLSAREARLLENGEKQRRKLSRLSAGEVMKFCSFPINTDSGISRPFASTMHNGT